MKLTIFDAPWVLIAASVPTTAIVVSIQLYNVNRIVGISLATGIIMGIALTLYGQFTFSVFTQRFFK